VAFLARLIGGPGYGGNGIFLRTTADTLKKIVAQGDVDPATARTFSNITWDTSPPTPLNNSGQVAFRATLAGTAPSPSGIFVGFVGPVNAAPVTVVLTGEATPDPSETFASFGLTTINNAGQVAFRATTSTGRAGLYVAYPGSPALKVVASFDAGPWGSTFPAIIPNQFTFNDLGEVGFMSPLDGGPGGGLFIGTGIGGPVPVVLTGYLAPPGGNFSIPTGRPDLHLNNSGDLVFRSDLTGGSADSGLFLIRRADGLVRTVAVQGQAAPGTAGSFATLSTTLNNIPGESASLTAGGEVWTSQPVLVGGENVLTFFRFGKDNQLEKAFARGDPAPQSGGGTIALSIQVEPTGVDAAGRYYFCVGVLGGKVSEGIYVVK
jgi:hypothetical protein